MFDYDFSQLFTLTNIAFVFVGSFIGLLIGAMPGMGTTLAIVLLLPFSYTMPPLTAILMLLAAYQGAEYGGSISSITLGIPGTPSAAATVIDGYAMAKTESRAGHSAFPCSPPPSGGCWGPAPCCSSRSPWRNSPCASTPPTSVCWA